jgi:HlyD family secretion protein
VRKLWIRRLLLGVFGLAVVGAIVYSFRPQPVGVDLARVARGALRVTVDEDGRTRIKERYVVSAPLAGQLLRIGLDPGDSVGAGKTVLAVLEPIDPALLDARARAEAEARVKASEAALKRADANLDRARAADELARSEHARARRLARSGSVSQQELDDAAFRERAAAEELRAAQLGVQIARFELELAQAALLRTRANSPGDLETWRVEVRSPIDGRVLRVLQESSAVVTPGTRLLELGDPTDLEIEIDVLSQDAVQIRPGAKVLLEHWGGEQPLVARVRLVEPAAFTKISALGVEEQRVWVVADFVDPPEKRKTLGDGYRVEARVVVWEGSDILQVPAAATFRQGEGWAVFVVADSTAVLRPVRLGRSNGLEVEVVEGLEENDTVIVHPSDKIKDGTAIVPR